MRWWKGSAAFSALAGTGEPLGSDLDVLAAVLAAGPVVKGVMLLLLGFSVVSWAVIFSKFRQLRQARQENREFFRRFWEAPDLAQAFQLTSHLRHSPAAQVLQQTLAASAPASSLSVHLPEEKLRGFLRRAVAAQGQRLGRYLGFLATCGNTAPFIGLFGTVWGIMTSFHAIGVKGSASLATVAPGIAEALVATAAGLAAAIPAVIAYNHFLGQVRQLESELRDFAQDLAPLLVSGQASNRQEPR